MEHHAPDSRRAVSDMRATVALARAHMAESARLIARAALEVRMDSRLVAVVSDVARLADEALARALESLDAHGARD